MPRKTKSKERLDKFYQMAKEQGYRSRASFKLIQLNAKFGFLNNCRVLVDLCAAPGGWLQVAYRFMPMGTVKIGIDLDPIQRIPGVKTFQEDITTQKCIDLLKKYLQGEKADVFLNDGAPNVGANWNKDALTQNYLVLSALKLTTLFLREGGYFVTKVFRSTDFNSLKWVFEKFFKKVSVTKPVASRNQSAETFVVCVGYLAPTFIDEKLFDPTYVFQDTEADHQFAQMNKYITSIDKLLEKRRNRGGYADDAPMHLFKQCTLKAFIEAENPFPIFKEYNQMMITEYEKYKYLSLTKNPEDLNLLLTDLKVLGKKDLSVLLKWRGKIKQALYKNTAKEPKEKKKREMDSDEELERELIQEQRRYMKTIRKEKYKYENQLLMSKGSIAAHNHEYEFENNLGYLLYDYDLEELSFYEPEESQENEEAPKMLSVNNKEMGEYLEQDYELRKERKIKKTKLIEKTRAEKKKKPQNTYVNEEKLKAQRMEVEEVPKKAKKNKIVYDFKFTNPLAGDELSDVYISENESEIRDDIEVDPDERMPNYVDNDKAYVIPKPMSDMEKRRKMLNRKRKKEERAESKAEKPESKIEIVPAKTMDDYDIDSLAETMAMAKKMLRNRNRYDIIDASYSRYTFEDHETLPNWFTDDEKKHNYKIMPITKEEYQKEKARLQAINARAPKKVLEAKIRKKMKMQRKMKKAQNRAQKVLDQDGIDEYHKMREVNKIYQKEMRANKTDKKYVVTKRWKGPGGKESRGVKYVDSRLKKDKRAGKRIKKTRHVHRKDKRKARF